MLGQLVHPHAWCSSCHVLVADNRLPRPPPTPSFRHALPHGIPTPQVHSGVFLPKEWIMNKWEEGYYITSLAGATNMSSLLVMSKGSKYTQQSYKVRPRGRAGAPAPADRRGVSLHQGAATCTVAV